MFVTPLFEGFVLVASLIIAIGAQNAFVLKQGLKRQHLFLTAMTCFICDFFLIVFGILGFSLFIADFPIFNQLLRWGGAIFLFGYGIRSFRSVFNPHALIADMQSGIQKGRWSTFLALLGFTFLNPHTWIDTVLILGSIGAERPDPEHLPFMLGALLASFIWFFGLTYGASRISPLFKKPRAWQVLDTIIGCVMIGIAISLVT